jgi:hypothetical protein
MSSSAYPSNGQLSTSPQEYDMDSNFTASTYSRTMYQHTQMQMDAATRSAKRRRASEKNGVAVLGTEGSRSSMDSRSSSLKDWAFWDNGGGRQLNFAGDKWWMVWWVCTYSYWPGVWSSAFGIGLGGTSIAYMLLVWWKNESGLLSLLTSSIRRYTNDE